MLQNAVVHYGVQVCVLCLLLLGMLWNLWCAQEGESELDEVERELGAKAKGSEPVNGRSANGDGKAKQLRKADSSIRRLAQNIFSPVFVEAFVLTFLAEWGDRSQIATIGAHAAAPARCTYDVQWRTQRRRCICK